MDPLAHRLANLLVGNKENKPTIEITLLGPVIQFEQDSLISICGGDFSPTIDGKLLRAWRTVLVKKGSQLRIMRQVCIIIIMKHRGAGPQLR